MGMTQSRFGDNAGDGAVGELTAVAAVEGGEDKSLEVEMADRVG